VTWSEHLCIFPFLQSFPRQSDPSKDTAAMFLRASACTTITGPLCIVCNVHIEAINKELWVDKKRKGVRMFYDSVSGTALI
jgi:hypothetical protein